MLKILLLDTILDFLYFPIWWYSKGLVLAVRWAIREVREMENFLGVGIWVKNIFVPMYGQSDIAGKIISFFMRIFQSIFRSLFLMGVTIFYMALFLVYLILPLVVLYGVFIHLEAVF